MPAWLAAPAAGADNSEAIFKKALEYTVQIKSTVSLPFDGDRKGSAIGAGFLVDAQRGWIMTNAHVVSRSPSRVEVAFHGKNFVDAAKVYVDPFLDFAIVKISGQADTAGINTPVLGCADHPPVGHPVGAFGHPWRLPYTGTRGIISGVTSKYETEVLQTDAPINQGNSGGPLISLDSSRIVGINTAGIRGAQNTNFAVAMKHACRILELLQAGKDPSPPDLPLVYFRDIDDRKVLKVARSYASPATLQLNPGDVIKEVLGVKGPVQNETHLIHALRGRLDEVSLKVVRGGKEVALTGRLPATEKVIDRKGVYASGILFGPARIRDAAEFNVRGMMVHHVERGSTGESQEIEKSDLLETVDGEPVDGLEALYRRLRAAQESGKRAVITLKRPDPGRGAFFTYIERNLEVSDLELIGAKEF